MSSSTEQYPVKVSPIYYAVYSNVAVFEMMVGDLPIMRRQADGFLNATQILKLAGFSKPRRTKILEKEVLKGTHEKIQGGYGKYQGTWIPLDASRKLAEKYNVIEILLEILDFDPITTAVPNKPAASKNEASTPRPKKIKRKVFPSPPRIAPSPERGLGGMDFHLTPSRIGPTPVMSGEESSPITRNRSSGGAHALASYNEEYLAQENFSYQKKRRKRELKDQLKSNIYFSPKNPPLSVREDLLTKIDTTTTYQQEEETMAEIHQRNLLRSPSHHRGIMLMEVLRRPPIQLSHQQRQGEILMCIWNDSPFPDILNLLRNPLVPYQFDINFLLDQEGNTCIHWAAALGKVDLLKSLIRHGANTDMVNKWGQSPIIGAVKLMHSYHVQTFSQLIDILRPCVYKIDSENKTLLHHISERAFTSLQSSFYYMHCITFWLDTKGDDTLFEFLNHQDDQGDTSLHISCRARAYLVSDLLVSLGAKKDIQNIHGENVWKVSLGDHRMFKILRSGEKHSTEGGDSSEYDTETTDFNETSTEEDDSDLDDDDEEDFEEELSIASGCETSELSLPFSTYKHSGLWAEKTKDEKVDEGFKKGLILIMDETKSLISKSV